MQMATAISVIIYYNGTGFALIIRIFSESSIAFEIMNKVIHLNFVKLRTTESSNDDISQDRVYILVYNSKLIKIMSFDKANDEFDQLNNSLVQTNFH